MKNEIFKLSDEMLIGEVKRLAGEERKLTAEILHYLCEVQRRRLFALYGYSSLFSFCVKYLGYTESQTQRRIEAMRAMNQIPEIEEKIKNGALSLTAVAQAQSYFRSQEMDNKIVSLELKKEILLCLENKSTRECEKELIKLSGQKPLPIEKTKVVSETHTQSTLNLSNEVILKLERIKALLSNKNSSMSQGELIDEMAEIVLNQIDPIRKVERREKAKARLQRSVSTAPIVTPKSNSEVVGRKSSLKNQITIRDQGRCSYISPITKQKCDSTFQLEVDHIHPKALGGETNFENLRLLCKSHNQRAAIELMGLGKMDQFINEKMIGFDPR